MGYRITENGVVPQVFVDLSDEELAELKITLGGKKVIRKAISMIKVYHSFNLH